MPKHLVTVKLGQVGGGHSGSRGKKVGAFGKLVDDGEDGIVATGSRGKLGDEIHSNAIPSLIRDFQWL